MLNRIFPLITNICGNCFVFRVKKETLILNSLGLLGTSLVLTDPIVYDYPSLSHGLTLIWRKNSRLRMNPVGRSSTPNANTTSRNGLSLQRWTKPQKPSCLDGAEIKHRKVPVHMATAHARFSHIAFLFHSFLVILQPP